MAAPSNTDLLLIIGADISALRAEIARSNGVIEKFAADADRHAKGAGNAMMAGLGRAATAVTGLVAAIGGLALLADLGKQIIDVSARFQKLEATLRTITGSAENARTAFDMLREFAAKTPFSVEQATEAFIKLKALGLTPSLAAITSYGNTASALGKDLNEMIEAVADAATGEFERLKEFGIKASSEGDRVKFTFQGVTTEIRKNASDIEAYLRRIGEVQFAGAMAEQANTIGGALSNLGDQWDQFLVNLGDTLPIQKAVEALAALLEMVNDILVETQQEKVEKLQKDLDGLNRAMTSGQDARSRAMRQEGSRVRDEALARKAELERQLAEARKELEAETARREKLQQGGGSKEQSEEEKKVARLTALLKALKEGGMDAYDALTLQQKTAEGGAAALEAQIDALKSSLREAAQEQKRQQTEMERLMTPWEKWSQVTQPKLIAAYEKGQISIQAYNEELAKTNPIMLMTAAMTEDLSRQVDGLGAMLAKDFEKEIKVSFEAGLHKGEVGAALRKPVDEAVERLAQSAADSLGNVFSRIATGDWSSVVEGVGNFQDRMRELEAQGLSSADALGEMAKAMVDSAEAGNALGNVLGGLFGRDKDQKKNANIGGAIGATAASALGLPKGLGALAGNLIGGLFGGNAKEDAINQALTQQRDALAKSTAAFLAAAQPVSDLAARFAALDEQFQTLRQEAEALGQPIDALTRSYEAQRRQMRDAFSGEVQDIIDRLTGREALADLRALQKAQDQRIKDALLAEVDLAQVRQANALELADFYARLSSEQLASMGLLVGQLDLVKARISDLTSTLTGQIEDMIGQAKSAASMTRQQANAVRQLAASLRETMQSLLVGDLSPLDPAEKLAATQTEFLRLYALAQKGDADAIGKLGAAGTDLLEAARGMYASGPQYAAIFDQVQEALAKTAVIADVRATAMDRIADLADVQVTILEDIRDLLASDLAGPLSDAVTSAAADGALTQGEAAGIGKALDDLARQFAAIGGGEAAAVRAAVEAMRPLVSAGDLSESQKAQLVAGQKLVADALTGFKSAQLDEYRKALVAAGDAIGKLEQFVLDPDGKIPAAIDKAFNGGRFDETLVGRIENLFRNAMGDTVIPLPLTGQIFDLFGRAIGNVVTIGDTLSARAAVTLAAAIGKWTADDMAARMSRELGAAIGQWGDVPLTQRVSDVFASAVGAVSGESWQGALRTMLDAQSPIVLGLTQLSSLLPELTAALVQQQQQNADQAAYDTAMQAAVTPVKRAIADAVAALAGAPDVEAAKKMTSSWLELDVSSGAVLAKGGKGSDSTSDARAKTLADSLSAIARQIEALTGGDIGQIAVNAGDKYGSGYNIGDLQKGQAFGINDFEGIARSFVTDALTQVKGGNQQAIEILRQQDFTNLSSAFIDAATEIFKAQMPAPSLVAAGAGTVLPSLAPAPTGGAGAFNAAAYLARYPDVAEAVAKGWFSAEEHYERYGKAEGRLPGFAAGGIVTGGVPGRDSVPILAMQGERVLSVPHSRMLETIYAAAAQRREGDGPSDAPTLHRQVQGMQVELERLSRAVLASNMAVKASVDGLRLATDAQTGVLRRVGAK